MPLLIFNNLELKAKYNYHFFVTTLSETSAILWYNLHLYLDLFVLLLHGELVSEPTAEYDLLLPALPPLLLLPPLLRQPLDHLRYPPPEPDLLSPEITGAGPDLVQEQGLGPIAQEPGLGPSTGARFRT